MIRRGLVLVPLAGLLLATACSEEDSRDFYVAGAQETAGAQEPLLAGAELAAGARGFPTLRSLDGETLAVGDFAQWLEGDRLHLQVLGAC